MNAQYMQFEPGAGDEDLHSYPNEQIVFVYERALTVAVEDEPVELTAGDWLLIPADVPHLARNDGDEAAKGVELFSPPRLDPPWEAEN